MRDFSNVKILQENRGDRSIESCLRWAMRNGAIIETLIGLFICRRLHMAKSVPRFLIASTIILSQKYNI